MPSEKKKKIVSEFKYLYDDEVIGGLTRYEVGILIIFGLSYFLRK